MLFHYTIDVSLVADIYSSSPVGSTACGVSAWLETRINKSVQCGYEENFGFF